MNSETHLGEASAELAGLDQQLARLNHEIHMIDAELSTVANHYAELKQRQEALTGQYYHLAHMRSVLLYRLSAAATPPQSYPLQGYQRAQQSWTPALIQNALLTVGWVLLSAGTIAFTVFAWSEFGIGGRAVILSLLTIIAGAVPVLLHFRFQMTATAETIAVFALLLIALDGYAAWHVGLSGVDELDGYVYSGFVATVIALVAAGYRYVVPLRLPQPLAVIVGQIAVALFALGIYEQPLTLGVVGVVLSAANVLAINKRTSAASNVASAANTIVTYFVATVGILLALGIGAEELTNNDISIGRQVGGAVLGCGVALLLVGVGSIAEAATAKRLIGFASSGLMICAGLGTVIRIMGHLDVADGYPIGYLAVCILIALLAGWGSLTRKPWREGIAIAVALAGTPTILVALSHLTAVGITTVTRAVTSPWAYPAEVVPDIHHPHLLYGVGGLIVVVGASVLAVSWRQRALALGLGLAGLGAGVILMPASLHLPAYVSVGAQLVVAMTALMCAMWPTMQVIPKAVSRGLFVALAMVLVANALLLALLNENLTLIALAVVATGFGVIAAMCAFRGDRLRWLGAFAYGVMSVTVASEAVAIAMRADGQPRLAEIVLFSCAPIPALCGQLVRKVTSGPVTRLRGTYVISSLIVGLVLAIAAVLVSLFHEPFAITRSLAAAAGLLVVALIWISRSTVDSSQRAGLYALLSMGGVVTGISAVIMAHVYLQTLFGPVSWFLRWVSSGFDSIASGVTTTNLLANEGANEQVWWGEPIDAAAMGLVALSVGMVAATVGDWRTGGYFASPLLGVAALSVPLAFDMAWQLGAFTALALAVIGGIVAGWAVDMTARAVGFGCALLFGATGISWSFAVPAAAIGAVGIVAALAWTIAVFGRDETARVQATAWAASALVMQALVVTTAVDKDRFFAGYLLLVVAAALSAIFAFTRAGAGPDRRIAVVEWITVGVGIGALCCVLGSAQHTAGVLTLGGVLVGLHALRDGRHYLGWVALAAETIGTWLWLSVAGVVTVEAYTLPAAIAAIGVGVIMTRRRPALSSWLALGPGLGCALGPSLVIVLANVDPDGVGAVRPVLLAVAAVATMVAGAYARRQAPFVLGAAVALTLSVRSVMPLVPQLTTVMPVWIPLASGGILLIAIGATWEQRRRDFKKLTHTIRTMA